jgi:hypothetical protein
MSDLISVQMGTIGSQSLPTGRNQAVSNLISAQNGAAANVTVAVSSAARLVPAPGSGSGVPETSSAPLAAGDTVTVTAGVPAQIYLDGERVGNDPNSATELTFVAPEGISLLRIHGGESADSVLAVERQTAVVTGKVVDREGSGVPNARVHLRHAGLEAEIYRLPSAIAGDEAPSLSGLKPASREPASSLNLRDPNQMFGYFPIGAISSPNFAVRLHGQFSAQTAGWYIFYLAATDGAQLSIDGQSIATAHGVKPGLEVPARVELSKGWHDIELLVYAGFGSAELVLSFTPPGGSRQTIAPQLLRAESTDLSTTTDADGSFAITVPAWLDQVEAIAVSESASGTQSGASEIARRGVPALGQVRLEPREKF